MGFLGSTALYPTVTPAADDLVPIVQASSGEQRTASVSGLTGTASELVVALTGTSHGILASYRSKLVTFSNAAAVAASLPQAGVTFPDGWFTDVKNIGAGTVTITPTTSTIDGAATLVLTTGKSCRIVSDGTNYRTIFITGTVDADDVTYTPTTLADWDGGADPGDVAPALDQLAERVTDLEAVGVGIGGSTGGTDNAVLRADGTGGATVQSSGVMIDDNDAIAGYKANRNEQTGTTYTLVAADTGKVVELTNAGAITLTVPNSLAEGFSCTILQGGAGQVTVAAGSGATMRNRQSHTKLAGQWAVGVIHVRDNSGGSAAEFVLGGDTAA